MKPINRRNLFRLGLPVLLTGAACAPTAVRALTISQQLSPKDLESRDQTFRVKVTHKDDLLQFEFSVEPHGRQLSPFLFGDLELYSAERHLGYVRVEPERTGDKVRYWFRVSDQIAADSRFTFRENVYRTVKDAQGHSHPEMMIGGREYWIRLGDFVEPARP